MADTKTGAPNIQDVFLNYARREKLAVVHIHLLDGREFEARIKNFDRFALIVEHAADHLIFKHAIATIRTPRSVPNYFSSHHPEPACLPPRHRDRARQRGRRRAAGRGAYGDEGSDTLGNIAGRCRSTADAGALGLGCARRGCRRHPVSRVPRASYGRMAERLGGQGLGDRPLGADGARARPAVPDVSPGFPRSLIAAFERRIGRPVLGNVVASGTASSTSSGRAHRDRAPIVYTSADSVFQIAAHEDVVPVESCTGWCEAPTSSPSRARRRPRDRAAVRGDARALHAHGEPPRLRAAAAGPTLLDPDGAGHPVTCHRQDQRPVRRARHHASAPTTSDDDGMDGARGRMARRMRGLLFANLVDFDTLYGHRNDVAGYARQPRALRRAARGLLPRCARRPAGRHRRPRQRSDDAEHRPLARVRAGAGEGAAREGRASTSARARPSPTSGRRSPRCSACRRCRTARAF
jgi:phosphopentomutase